VIHKRKKPRFREALFVLFSCAGAIHPLYTAVVRPIEQPILVV
jgi:hypothetical protein